MDRNTVKTAVLLAGLGGLCVLIGSIWGRGGTYIGLGIGFVFVFSSYWFSDKIAIASARAQAVTEEQAPQLYQIVRDLTQRAGMPMPKIYVTPDMQPNAFATGRNPRHAAVACTQGILQMLNYDELRGVLAHEISHVRNRDILISSVAASVAMGITLLARMAMWGAMFGGFGGGRDEGEGNVIGSLLLIVLAPVAAAMLQLALSRSREYEADRSGALLIQDPGPLESALAKIDAAARQIPMKVDPAHATAYIINPLANRKSWFSDHPPTADRIRRLEELRH